METENIKYTNAALEQLEKFKMEQANKLEQLVVENKRFPGIDFIEITASDVQEGAKKFVYEKSNKYYQLRYLILIIYFASGIGIAAIGLLKNTLIDIWKNDPTQFLYLVTGSAITLMSGILYFFLKKKEMVKNQQLKEPNFSSEEKRAYFDELLKSLNEVKSNSTKNNDNELLKP